jgi:protein-tyrosine phosphatase
MNSTNDIFWIGGESSTGLAIVLRPRGGDWLEDELVRYKNGGIDSLISMLEPGEAEELGLSDESVFAAQTGLKYLSYPILDRHVPPDVSSFRNLAREIAESLRNGARIGVHCRGSIGRATLVAACALVELGWKPEPALEAIEAARGCPVPDTPEQRAWILNYEAGQ